MSYEKLSAESPALLLDRTVVLVGLMGVGKSSVGWRLAQRLNMPFFDSDREIERAAGCSILDIYERWGEKAFRDAEQKIVQRLLGGPPHVLATGDGSFLSPVLRSLILKKAISVWMKADLETIFQRVKNRQTRPQFFDENSRSFLQELARERDEIYGLADLYVESQEETHGKTVEKLLEILAPYKAS